MNFQLRSYGNQDWLVMVMTMLMGALLLIALMVLRSRVSFGFGMTKDVKGVQTETRENKQYGLHAVDQLKALCTASSWIREPEPGLKSGTEDTHTFTCAPTCTICAQPHHSPRLSSSLCSSSRRARSCNTPLAVRS